MQTRPLLRPRRTTLAGVMLAALVVPLAACGSGDPLAPQNNGNGNTAVQPPASGGTGGSGGKAIKIGSAEFPESALLGEIYAQALEGKGFTVTRQFNIGSRETYIKAITGGEVDLVPEYTGSLLTFYDKNATVGAPDQVYTDLKSKLPADLTVLAKSAAEDKNSIVVTKDTATQWSLKGINDLAAHQGELSIMAAPEFKTRKQGLVGLKDVYNVVPAEFRPQQSQAAVVDALKNGQVKAGNIYSTDPAIVANGFVVLEDPKALFGSDNVVPLVRKASDSPELASTLDAVSAKLDTPTLADLVKQVVADKKDASAVAKDWLTKAGLL